MANVYYRIRSTKTAHTVNFQVTCQGKVRLISTGIKVDSPECWDEDAKDGPVVGMDGARAINALLRQKMRTAKEALAEAELQADGAITMEEAVSAISKALNPDRVEKVQDGQFLMTWREFSNTKQGRTFELYHETLKRLKRYVEDCSLKPVERMTFEDINIPWIERFNQWMSKTRSVNSRAIDLRNLRAVCMYAWKMEITEKYVWKRYHIERRDSEEVQTLTDEQFRRLFTFPLDSRPDLQMYRDIALLGLYLIGINIVDMHSLTHIDEDGYIRYKRAKTHRQYCIKVEPEAMAIIERYRGKTHLLSWADRYRTCPSFRQHLNEEGLQRIGECEIRTRKGSYHSRPEVIYRPIVPDITYYWLRRYWATTAYNLGISEDTIAQALGHGRRTVTDVYIRKEQRMIDDANRKVIDHVLELMK